MVRSLPVLNSCLMTKRLRRLRFLSAATLLFSYIGMSVDAATLTVTSSADLGGSCPSANCSLRQAVASAASGDTINFSLPANTAITLTTDSLVIGKNLTITGPGANLLTVQRSSASGIPAFRIFRVAAGVTATISGLTMTNGLGQSTSGIGDNGDGGGVFNQGTVTIRNCAIVANRAQGDGEGGGLFNSSNMTVVNCLLSGNDSVFGGGAYNTGTMALTNTTLSENTAPAFHGGGLDNEAGTLTINNCTIAANSGNIGGGVYIGGGTVNLQSTLIASNTAATSNPDVHGTLTSQGYNLISNTTGATITGSATGNQLNVDPNLDLTLRDNGGPTKTHALLSGSRAIEGGISPVGTTTDQRGFARPVDDPGIANASGGDGTDIGAYEVQADQLPGCRNINAVVGSMNDSGTDSLRGIIANVCSGTSITFGPAVRGTINLTSGELLINKSVTINGPGSNLLTIQRSAGAPTNFRIIHINGNFLATLSGLTIAKGNIPGGLGGGISNDNGTLTLSGVTVSGSTADIGAGIYTARAATITNSTISGNTVSGNNPGGGGGGIYNQGGTLSRELDYFH